MNRILSIGCALAVIAAPAATLAAPISLPQAPAVASGLEFVNAMTKTVAADGTHVYRQPVVISKVVSMLDAGTRVIVLDKTADKRWDHVQVGSVTGYVRVNLLK
jgi:uncharacterized protein YgiM (DUF1202 family)